MNAGIVNGALAELNASNVLATAVASTRKDLADLNLAWQKLVLVQNSYRQSYDLAKQVVVDFAQLYPTQTPNLGTVWERHSNS